MQPEDFSPRLLYALQSKLLRYTLKIISAILQSCHAASTDLPDPLSPPVYHPSFPRDLPGYILSRGPREYIAYEFLLTSPAASRMSGSSNLDSCFFSIRSVSVHVVHPYSSIDTTAAWKKLRFILSVRSDFHMTDCLSIAVHAFAGRVLNIPKIIEN